MAVWRDRRRADLGDLALMSRRFPPSWSVEETDSKLDRRCFIVRDANGHALAYVYFEGEAGRQAAAKLLTRDEGPTDRRQHRQAAGAVSIKVARGKSP
jgi:putative heme degradation protein